MKARLAGWRELAPGVRHFEFEAVDWNAAFVPGQFLSLTAKIGEDEITRAYSIASAPSPGSHAFSLCANLVDGGKFSPHLFALESGEEIQFKGPYGAFIPRRPVSDSIFVATGTGVAPFRAMLQTVLAENPDRGFELIFGVRSREGLLYHDEFVTLAEQHSNFVYRPTLTRPPEGWTGLTGRVQGHVMASLGERRDIDVYICGLKEMVDDLRAQLKGAGLDRKRIVYEKYD
ncbi:MAG TPA: FAD-dependent oxidoreductase [Bryobacteraceae bacterium]|nr:FAD-dependent oxidoreductase [Bryobacteraceae bacterium]